MSDLPPVIIRVGSALDASVEKTYANVEARATKAASTLDKVNKRTTTSAEKEAQKQAAAFEKEKQKEETAATKAATKEAALAEKAADASIKSAKRAADQQIKEADRASAAKQKASLRGFEQIGRAARASEQNDIRQDQRSNDRFARRAAFSAVRTIGNMGRTALRTGAEIARGMGVDFNLGSAISRNVDRETLSTSLSNSGYQEHTAGPNGQRVAAGTLLEESKKIANATGLDPTAVLEGEKGFVGITGNLDQARKMMGGLAVISKATSSDMGDVSKAAAKINAQMADTPTKAEDTLAVVRLLAGQGKLGAAEMEDYAKSIGQIAGTAHRFHGDTAKNIGQLSAMAQLSVQGGFNKGPVQAATSIAAFSDTFSKTVSVKKFAKAFNVSPEAMEKKLSQMDPEEIIKATLLQTKGDKLKMGDLFSSGRSHKAVMPFEQAFNDATGGKTDQASLQKGVEAVNEMFKHLMDGAMSQDEVNKEFANQMNTTKSKAQLFQNKLDDVAQNLQASLLPSLEKLEGPVLELAQVMASFATWAVENPKQLIGGAIVAAIGKAAIGAAFTTALETLMKGNKMPTGGPMGAVAGLLGIATLVVTTLEVGTAIIDFFAHKDADKQRDAVAAGAEAQNALNIAKGQLESGDVEGAKKTLLGQKSDNEEALKGLGKGQSEDLTDKEIDDKREGFTWKKFVLDGALGGGDGAFGLRKDWKITDKDLDRSSKDEQKAENQMRSRLVELQEKTLTVLGTISTNTASGRQPPNASVPPPNVSTSATGRVSQGH